MCETLRQIQVDTHRYRGILLDVLTEIKLTALYSLPEKKAKS